MTEFINKKFRIDERIKLPQVLSWVSTDRDIRAFLTAIGQVPPDTRLISRSKVYFEGPRRELVLPVGDLLESSRMQERVTLIEKLAKNFKKVPHIAASDTSCQPHWVYGFRCHDLARPTLFLTLADGVELILYSTSCYMVIYEVRCKKQHQYQGHTRSIISFAVSHSQALVASGDTGPHAGINIWSLATRRTLGTITGIHQTGVHLLEFLPGDEILVSCSIRKDSPVLLHSTCTF